MSFLISVPQLKKRLQQNRDDTVVIDVRFSLQHPNYGKQAYAKDHIPQALFLDVNQDLSGPVQKHGGNHPLPDVKEFAEKLGNLGVRKEKTVVIYDNGYDMFAARLWWLLHYVGHEEMYILDGGYDRWLKEGNEVTSEIPITSSTSYERSVHPEEVIHITEVKRALRERSAVLIDSRSEQRYLGEEEPLYKKAGHIPGAKNFYWKDVFHDDGKWKDIAQLEKHFASFRKDDKIIVSCGSEISACTNIVALKRSGFRNVMLYPGSYSDWISYDENEIETRGE